MTDVAFNVREKRNKKVFLQNFSSAVELDGERVHAGHSYTNAD